MLRVVAHVHARDENIPRSARRWRNRPTAGTRDKCGSNLIIQPENTQPTKLFIGERLGCARITPVHVPGVFSKNCAHVGSLHLLIEHIAVKIFETGFNIYRQIHPRW